jgi:hypothetical protein
LAYYGLVRELRLWPWDYPVGWLIDNGLSWNEQYLVQAFLMNNEAFRLRLSVQGLVFARWELVETLFGPDGLQGASIWIEKVA